MAFADGVGLTAVAMAVGVKVGEGAVPPFAGRSTVATTVIVGEDSDALLGVGLENSTLLAQADTNTPAIKPDITTTARSSVSVLTPASNRRTCNQLV